MKVKKQETVIITIEFSPQQLKQLALMLQDPVLANETEDDKELRREIYNAAVEVGVLSPLRNAW